MSRVDLPQALTVASWDKHKAALAKLAKPPAAKVGDELKQLTRLFLAIDWVALSGEKLASEDEAQAALAQLESAAKGPLKALVEQAKSAEAVAGRFEDEAKKDKQCPKELLAAAQAIGRAAKSMAGEVEAFVSDVRKSVGARAAALAGQARKGGAAATATGDSKAAKIVRTRVLDALRRVKKPAPGAKPVRFLLVAGKSQAALFLGLTAGAAHEKMLKGLLPGEAPFKTTRDTAGEVVWEKNALTFVSDRVAGSLLKKAQPWLRKILKLNLRMRVRNSSGVVEEIAGDDLPDALLAPDAAELAERAAAGKGFAQRLAQLQPQILKAMNGPDGAELKQLVADVGTLGKSGDFGGANDLLDDIESLLQEGEGAAASGGDAAPQAAAGVDPAAALAAWQTQRIAALASLKLIAGKVAAARHPQSAKSLVELNGVMKNLPAAPASAQAVRELLQWLQTDDVVAEVSALAEDIRSPLIASLQGLRARYGV